MRTRPLLFLAAFAIVVVAAFADDADNSKRCSSSDVVAVPTRPTFSNATDTTRCGVLEAESGVNQLWLASSGHADGLNTGLRFGVTSRLDLHWSADEFVVQRTAQGSVSGRGDAWFGAKCRFKDQSGPMPSFAVMYMAKAPLASPRDGLGTGVADHAISLLISRNFAHWHADGNVVEFLGGRPAGGYDHSAQFSADLSRAYGRIGVIVEGYGGTSLNRETPGFASTLLAVTYTVSPAVVVDGGVDVGLTPGASRRMFFGATYAVTNLYRSIGRLPRLR